MSIWFNKEITIDQLKPFITNTMDEHLGIEWVEIGNDFLKAKMPVDHRTRQAYGFLHGGASCVLAEMTGSIASALVIDHSKFSCAGLEINANHIRIVTDGYVTGTARPLHLGSTTHVWDIRIEDERERLACVSRLTVAILQRKN